MAVGIHLWGTTGVAIAHVVVICVVVMPAYLIAVDRLTGVSPRGNISAVLPAVFGAVVAGAADYAVTRLVAPAWVQLITGLLVGAVVYAICTARYLQTLLPQTSTPRLGRAVAVARALLNSADRPRRLLVQLGSASALAKSK
jgi:PST family polysaccharide transporter